MFEAEDSHPGSQCPLPALQISRFILEVHVQQHQTQGWMWPAISVAPETISDSWPSSHAHKLFRDATTFQARKQLLQVPSGICFQHSKGRTMCLDIPNPWIQPWQGHRLTFQAAPPPLTHPLLLALTLSIGRGCHDTFHMTRFVTMGEPRRWLPQKESHHEF